MATVLTMQISHDHLAIIRARQQIVGIHAEAHSPHITCMRAECLHEAVAPDVPQHNRGVLVARGEETARGVDAHRGERRA